VSTTLVATIAACFHLKLNQKKKILCMRNILPNSILTKIEKNLTAAIGVIRGWGKKEKSCGIFPLLFFRFFFIWSDLWIFLKADRKN
jgi:hypothetical protein